MKILIGGFFFCSGTRLLTSVLGRPSSLPIQVSELFTGSTCGVPRVEVQWWSIIPENPVIFLRKLLYFLTFVR